ncbi:MAG: ATP-binding cassette domain-containing protein, partial [Chloroflexi bacterium]|nr:ATP-binding cassette domain-containing protein [Chloroflexota bacterium]
MHEESIVIVRGLHKTYDTGKVKVHAVCGVDFPVRRGEMVAIMGPSGCGKTTLLNCMSGIDDIDGSEVVIEGARLHNMTDNRRTDYRAGRMGFVFHMYNLLPVLSSDAVPTRWRFSVPVGEGDFRLQGVYQEDETMSLLLVEVRDPYTGAETQLTVIGVLKSTNFNYGVY